jgi:hypothetical protein
MLAYTWISFLSFFKYCPWDKLDYIAYRFFNFAYSSKCRTTDEPRATPVNIEWIKQYARRTNIMLAKWTCHNKAMGA